MVSFWSQYFSDSKLASNCRIISGDGKIKNTHKIFLSAISDDLRCYLLSTLDWAEEACFILPDFTMDEIEDCFSKLLDKEEHPALFKTLGIFKHSKEENKIAPGNPIVNLDLKPEKLFSSNKKFKHEDLQLQYPEQFLKVNEEGDLLSNESDCNLNSKVYNKKRKRKKVKSSNVNLKPDSDIDGDGVVKDNNCQKLQHACQYCKRKFKSEDSLFGHVTLKHPEKHEFLQYMAEVNGEFQCTICKKMYSKRRRCNIHIRSKHKIGAKLECEICQQVFYFKHELELHMVKHTQAKDAYCHLCGKGVRVAANLQRHMIAFHTNKAEKELSRTFFCTVCGKGFFTSGALKEHEMLHSDAYNFQCSECPKTFKQSAGLRTHFRRHHTNFEKTPEQKAKFAAYMQQYRAKQREKERLVRPPLQQTGPASNIADNKKNIPTFIADC